MFSTRNTHSDSGWRIRTATSLFLVAMWAHAPLHVFAQTTSVASTSATSTTATTTAAVSTSAVVSTSTSTSSSVAASTSSAVSTTSTSATSTTSTSTTSAAATTTYTGTPSLGFYEMQTVTMTACASAFIGWALVNEDPSKVNITLYAVDEGVDQSIPAASATTSSSSVSSTSKASTTSPTTSSAAATSSAATSTSTSTSISSAATTTTTSSTAVSTTATASLVARAGNMPRTILDINMTLVTQYANVGWSFNPVKLPEGRYYLLGVVDDGHGTTAKSAVFSVVEGNNTACLAAYASESKTATATATNTATKSATAGAGSASSNGSSGGGISKGAIAGIAVGVILGLAALAALAFICLRRRRQARNEEDRYTSQPPMSMTATDRHHKMQSGPTSPSEFTHAQSPGFGQASGSGPFALTAARADGGYRSDAEKAGSVESLVGTAEDGTPIVLGHNGNNQETTDPFATPRIPDAYGGYTTMDFTPTAVPAPAVLARPAASSEQRSRSQPSYDNGTRRPSPPASGNTTPPIGLGFGTPTTPATAATQMPGIGRNTSLRRKPVPSLGPELRTALAKQSGGGGGGESGDRDRRTSYSLMPDPPARLG